MCISSPKHTLEPPNFYTDWVFFSCLSFWKDKWNHALPHQGRSVCSLSTHLKQILSPRAPPQNLKIVLDSFLSHPTLNPREISWASRWLRRQKRLPAMQETQVRSLVWEDPRGKETATHSSTRLENPTHRGAWWAIYNKVHGVAKSRTWMSNFTFTFNHQNILRNESLFTASHDTILTLSSSITCVMVKTLFFQPITFKYIIDTAIIEITSQSVSIFSYNLLIQWLPLSFRENAWPFIMFPGPETCSHLFSLSVLFPLSIPYPLSSPRSELLTVPQTVQICPCLCLWNKHILWLECSFPRN